MATMVEQTDREAENHLGVSQRWLSITLAKVMKGGLLRFSQNFPGQVEQKGVKYL